MASKREVLKCRRCEVAAHLVMVDGNKDSGRSHRGEVGVVSQFDFAARRRSTWILSTNKRLRAFRWKSAKVSRLLRRHQDLADFAFHSDAWVRHLRPRRSGTGIHRRHWEKRGEKVDYAIMQRGKPAILIECKRYGSNRLPKMPSLSSSATSASPTPILVFLPTASATGSSLTLSNPTSWTQSHSSSSTCSVAPTKQSKN